MSGDGASTGVRGAGSVHSFGAELRRRRGQAGVSLGQLANLTHYSKGHLSKIESDLKRPSEQLARQCDAALSTDGALLALWMNGLGGRTGNDRDAPPSGDGGHGVPAAAARPPWRQQPGHSDRNGNGEGNSGASSWAAGTWILELAPDGRGRFAEGAVRSLTVAPHGLGVVTFAGAHRRGAPDVAGLDALAASLRELGRTTSPAAVLPMAISQLHTIRVLASNAAHGEDRKRLFRLASHVAEFTGWMAQESGDDRAAVWWTEQAVELSETAGGESLGEYARVRRALVSMYRGDASETVGLVAPLVRRSGSKPRVRWLAALRQAQGHALDGNRSLAMRALDAASEVATRLPDDEPGPVLGPASTPDQASLVRGWCLVDLSLPTEACQVLGPELDRLTDGSQSRARARFGVRLAWARAATGDLDAAGTVLDGIAGDVWQADSATVRADLRAFAAASRRWQHRSAAHGLRARLRSLAAVS